MVRRLAGDVASHRLHLRKPDGEHPVAILPGELIQLWSLGFEPQRGAAFEFLDQLGRLASAREGRENVDMVFDPTNNQRLAMVVGQNASQIAVQFLAQELVTQKGPTLFGGENRVDQNLGEGLWHARTMVQLLTGFNSFGVG